MIYWFQKEAIEKPLDIPEVLNDFDIEEDEIAIENRYVNFCGSLGNKD